MEESRYDRRFVLPMVPEWINHSDNPEVDCVAIEQGYLMAGENEELRIRREKNKYTITHKIGHGPLCETGFEKLPNKQAFNILLQLVKGRPIHKTGLSSILTVRPRLKSMPLVIPWLVW